MTDVPPQTQDDSPDDMAAQLESLLEQVQSGDAPGEQDEASAATAVAESEFEEEFGMSEETEALTSQIDALMAQVSGVDEKDEAPEDTANDQVIADGPADVEAALDGVQGAFDAVQDVIAEIEEAEEAEAQAIEEIQSAPQTDANDEPAAPTRAELDAQEDDLAAQVQSLLDEAQAEEAAGFVSPEEVINEYQDEPTAEETAGPIDDQDLEGHFHATVDDVIAETQDEPEAVAPQPVAASPEPQAQAVEPEPTPEPTPTAEATEASADDPPLIEQIDTLLADHAEDAISGEFESVDELLGVGSTPEADSSETEEAIAPEDDAEEADDLGGDFQSMEDLLGNPDEASEPEAEAAAKKPTREEMSVELDQLDGLFAAPTAIAEPDPAPPAEEATPEEEPAEDDDVTSGFESLDDLLDAPPPTEEERDGAPPAAADSTPAEKQAGSAESGLKLTLKLALFKAAAVFLLGWTLWACAIVNQPLDKLPEQIKQTVGWVALAVVGPAMLLITYGLFLG
ncbi:hypothetical protein [Algisphaera agarilytica]|uniref:Uncharacterized protein n=1 Tax=Algisphaera agarilytica TaxID=1385975 RepID=A0A7X0H4Z8_9BACT|nr:hypothetical protein [Algisphaera agarilytica]MBB6429335.1 hypothetical protein [Algisphaera agarilytica]